MHALMAYSDDIDSVTVRMHVADSYYAGTDYRIFFAFGDAESTFGGIWSQISTVREFADRGVQQYNNILKVFDGPSRGDQAEVKFDLTKAFQKDRVSVSDLSNWTPGIGQIVWKGQLELDKWVDQDQKPLSIDEPSTEAGSCPRFSGKGAVIGKRQNEGENTPPEWDVWGAFEEAKKHLEANTQVGRNRYPHQFNNREALQIPEEFRNRRLQEFPILRGQTYSGQAPGAMRVILAQVGNDWMLAGVMRHPTGRGNAFELCQEWGNAYMAQCWPNGLDTLQHLEYPGCDRA
ncbi:Ribonuclease/ribotoxin [Aspergillus alliaceus]|uniref:Ribonuclease/ribotoxin n=1 Tax=Petromyces alliaceus TaxID=209559 RepID=UPI0012A6010A|nr:Ribonuclease/ribotoxin [Aspergillus alliaceus]KAB8230298.1 Ribonuclease/ribotoxin [Aspergillus alliaceus]